MRNPIFGRGNRYLFRNFGKTAALFLIVFVLGNVFSASLAVHGASSQAEAALLSKFKVIAWVEPNYDPSKYTDDECPKITETTSMALANLPEVAFYDFSLILSLPLEKKEVIIFEGAHHHEPLDFYLGINQIVDGRLFSADEMHSGVPCAIISETIAEEYLLHVGDQASFTYDIALLPQYNKSYKNPNQRAFVFTVIGVFRPVEGEVSTKDIYMPNNALAEERLYIYAEFTRSLGIEPEVVVNGTEPIYYALQGPREINSFKRAAAQILDDNFQVVFSTDQFEHFTGPINATRSISSLVFWLSSGIATLVLMLIILLFMHTRKFEFGIYLSLGVKRRLLYTQAFYEIFAVVATALLPAYFTGKYISNGFLNLLLKELTVRSTGTSSSQWGNLSVSEVQSLLKTSRSTFTVLYYLTAGIGIALTAVAISLFYIYRVSPKEIMLEEQS